MHLLRNCLFGLLALNGTMAGTVALAQDDSKEPMPEGILAVVNGRPIQQLSVDNVAQQITEGGQEAEPERILEELINLEVLTQAAEAMDLDKEEVISATLQLQYTQTMANAYLARKSAELSFTDDELREEYESQSATVERSEFRASHILLESQEAAAEVIQMLDGGREFADLASEYSIDATSENGGDLGWFQSSTMAPEFSEAVAELNIGETTENPVQSEYGFHIIMLVDKRDAALPDFDAVKSGLVNLAARKALARHVDELKAAADITIRPDAQ
ncbi:MAG: peptidylprolyl isomerase [Granulosicoccus sp.]|nr:peptidylprolyl isomerase [Granulosicoccus sp.]